MRHERRNDKAHQVEMINARHEAHATARELQLLFARKSQGSSSIGRAVAMAAMLGLLPSKQSTPLTATCPAMSA